MCIPPFRHSSLLLTPDSGSISAMSKSYSPDSRPVIGTLYSVVAYESGLSPRFESWRRVSSSWHKNSVVFYTRTPSSNGYSGNSPRKIYRNDNPNIY